MKKRLEAELISIAHRILKLKNKSDVDQLYKETQKLYESLTVLKFYQDNFETFKDEVDAAVLDEKLIRQYDKEEPQEVILEVKQVETPEVVAEEKNEEEAETVLFEEVEEAAEPVLEEETIAVVADNEPEEALAFKPIFELTEEEEIIEPAETAAEVNPKIKQAAIEELFGENYVEPVFVKPNEISLFSTEIVAKTKEAPEATTTVLNPSFSKTIEIGLNDRVAFVNNLFGESNEDFNRVISQLNTFDSFDEAKTFLTDMIIPDYDNWVGKEDYTERFMAVVEKKFA